MALTVNIIRKIMPYCPKSRAELYVPLLNEACSRYGITTELRMASFLATLAVESGELRYTKELADGWAYDISRNKEKARGLGNLAFGDGPKYKGHGLIQITGKSNHRACTVAFGKKNGIDFVLFPEKLAEPRWAVESACWFWQSHGCNELADKNQFRAIQSLVNRGTTNWQKKPAMHLQQRLEYYGKAIAWIPDNFNLSIDETPTVLTLVDHAEGEEDFETFVEPTSIQEPINEPEPNFDDTTSTAHDYSEEGILDEGGISNGGNGSELGAESSPVDTSQTNGTPAITTDNIENVKVNNNPAPVEGGGINDAPVELTKERPSFQTMVQSGLAWLLATGAGAVGAFKLFFEQINEIPTINIVIICAAMLGFAFLAYKIYNDSAERANKLNLAKMQHFADPAQINVDLRPRTTS